MSLVPPKILLKVKRMEYIMFKKSMLIVCIFAPSIIKKIIYRRLLGWDIHPSAKIGFSFVNVQYLSMAQGSLIGSLTMVKGLNKLEMGERSVLGSLNWVTAFPQGTSSRHFCGELERDPSLFVGSDSAITSRHIIDCTSSVTIGSFTTFAGFRSQILTHSINLKECIQSSRPVVIGEYCFIGTGSILLPGSVVPDYCVVSAGAVVAGKLGSSRTLYGGVPAKPLKIIERSEYKYMSREEGFVW
jgi:serine acetyltransferase